MRQPTIVIGSGFGGLAAALRLRARGEEVILLERQGQIGGRATSFEEKGYTFDAGPTVITAPFLFEELFRLFDRSLEDVLDLRPLDPWYRIRFDDGDVFDYSGSLDATLEQIRRIEPRDVDGYQRFLARTEEIYRVGFEQLGDQPFLTVGSMLRALPSILRLEGTRSVYGRASRYLRSEKLRQVFSFQPLLVGGNPLTTTSIYSLIHVLERRYGVHFAMGGTRAIVQALGVLLDDVGVDVRVNATVSKIEIQAGRVTGVRLEDGSFLPAGRVVANADPPFVYEQLIDPEHRRRWTPRRLERLRYSMGLFVLYFGARRSYTDLAHHEILLGPRYGGLLRDIFDRKVLADDPSLYLHAPTRTDPSLSPPGGESMYALAPVPNLQGGIDWDEAGPRMRDRLLEEIEDRVCPGLRDALEVDTYVTPEHFRGRLLSKHGSGFSIQPLLTQSAYFRFHNRCPDVGGLYFVGAGTQPGAGLPGVLTSAKVLERILDDEEDIPRRSMPVRTGAGPAPAAGRHTAGTSAEPAARVMAQRGKTFAWGRRLLPRDRRDDIATLYAFCRHVDDLADDRSDDASALRALASVQDDLARGRSEQPRVAEFLELAPRRNVPLACAHELVEGVRSDVGRVRIHDEAELLRYCYRVASTVGVMTCSVLDVREREAWPFAVDLGIAMQLTNIARDVREDHDDDRIYVPAAALDHGRVASALGEGDPVSRRALFDAVGDLLSLAARYYRSAERGMRFLPAGARWGILTASRSYEAIGHRILAAGPGFWDERVATSRWTKLRHTLASGLRVALDPRYRPGRAAPRHERGLHLPLATLQSARELGLTP
jgi:phytoene desaturase